MLQNAAASGNHSAPSEVGFKALEGRLSEIIAIYVLSGLYFLLFVFPLVQVIRIRLRNPYLGWNTQKIFLTLTSASSIARSAFFASIPWLNSDSNWFVPAADNSIPFTLLMNTPRIIYITTYLLLVLFWAEIIHRVTNRPLFETRRLRPIFVISNALMYLIQVVFWILLLSFSSISERIHIPIVENMFYCAVSVGVTALFVIFGGRLFFMLRSFPIESTGRESKLYEVGLVTVICSLSFLARAAFLAVRSFSLAADLSAWFVLVYYIVVEIVPSGMVLLILHKLPPSKENSVNSPLFNSSDQDYSYGTAYSGDSQSGEESWVAERRVNEDTNPVSLW